MILHGNQRGGAKDMALHLMKDENEHIEVYEIRGFASENLIGAFNEAYAISRATRCKQFLYSLSLNPPPDEQVSTESFKKAINQAEQRLGLDNQPRVIVFHEKQGRRHCHVVWSRIDSSELKAIRLPFTKLKLRELSRELFLEHGWAMPEGLRDSHNRDPRNFTLAEWQQAKRTGKNPKQVKAVFQECWNISDTQSAFANALKEHGYILARGDRRGFVAVDFKGEAFAVSKWVGIKAKDVKAKLNEADKLLPFADAKAHMANAMAATLQKAQEQQNTAIRERQNQLEARLEAMAMQHKQERQNLEQTQDIRRIEETKTRQARYSKGLRGLWQRLDKFREQGQKHITQDIQQYREIQQHKRDTFSMTDPQKHRGRGLER
ncbi:hypothetical protein AB835_05930 [Candidatus Endobugula sertula]|uniref:MobA/VirD2-like nuclease domain-containing protein n=1 Tax=Candidatus Endobugula sertula TaxID=62101 RepID=A0A1D2QR20_9GAMM|nr:hypothetical protein AB835_05930 [Candidatus Endobugula sertula]